jgi:hypothetical protein
MSNHVFTNSIHQILPLETNSLTNQDVSLTYETHIFVIVFRHTLPSSLSFYFLIYTAVLKLSLVLSTRATRQQMYV